MNTRMDPKKFQPSGLLGPEDNARVARLLTDKAQSLATAVVQFYQADRTSQWQKVLTGVACLTKDSRRRSYFIQVFDLDAACMAWEQEIYNEFRINRATSDDVLIFEADTCMAALYFAKVLEAESFVEGIQNRLARLNKPKTGHGKGTIAVIEGPGVNPGVVHSLDLEIKHHRRPKVTHLLILKSKTLCMSTVC